MQIVDIYRGSIVDVASRKHGRPDRGAEEKVDSMLDLLQGFGIRRDGAHGPSGPGTRAPWAAATRRMGSAVWKARSNGKAEDVTAGRQTTGGV